MPVIRQHDALYCNALLLIGGCLPDVVGATAISHPDGAGALLFGGVANVGKQRGTPDAQYMFVA